MRILITGIQGFIGSHLAERFEQDGHDVFGVDNLETGRAANFAESRMLDIADRRALYAYANFVKPELVVHCAASYSDPNKWHRDVDTNMTGTINTILAAQHHQAKLVYFQTALPPVSSYAISKIGAQRYIELSELPALVFRLANIYGPRNVSGPIPAFYKRLSAGEPCTVVHTSRDMVYVADLVECVTRAIATDTLGCFDVCSGEETPIVELYRAVASHFADAPEAVLMQPTNDDVPTVVSVDARLPGWQATTPIAEGVADAVTWYRQHGVEDTYTHLKLKETA